MWRVVGCGAGCLCLKYAGGKTLLFREPAGSGMIYVRKLPRYRQTKEEDLVCDDSLAPVVQIWLKRKTHD